MEWRPVTGSDNRVSMIFNDCVVSPLICNFKCDYCLNTMNPYKKESWRSETNDNQKSVEQWNKEKLIYKENTDLKCRVDKMFNNFSSIIDSTILRISGGEILNIKNVIELFHQQSLNYEVLQIVTNGYCLTEEMVSELKKIPNCHIHMSLDGHNLELNGHRLKTQAQQERLMENLDRIIRSGFPVEIGSVLTKRNTKKYSEFLEYLLKYDRKVKVHPSVVRGDTLTDFIPTEEDIEKFSHILDNFDRYKSILPPKAYLEQLILFMKEGKRVLRCHIPKLAIQSIDDGVLTSCPNYWSAQIGNIFDEDLDEVKDRIGKIKLYNLYLQKRPRLNYCQHCYTSYDVVNLYIEGYITDEEMRSMPLFSGEKTFARLKLLRQQRELEE